jgi:hypothetical protein
LSAVEVQRVVANTGKWFQFVVSFVKSRFKKPGANSDFRACVP